MKKGMTTYNVYVTELWNRRYTVEAETPEEAIVKVKEADDDGLGRHGAEPELEGTFEPTGEGVDAESVAWMVRDAEGNEVPWEPSRIATST